MVLARRNPAIEMEVQIKKSQSNVGSDIGVSFLQPALSLLFFWTEKNRYYTEPSRGAGIDSPFIIAELRAAEWRNRLTTP